MEEFSNLPRITRRSEDAPHKTLFFFCAFNLSSLHSGRLAVIMPILLLSLSVRLSGYILDSADSTAFVLCLCISTRALCFAVCRRYTTRLREGLTLCVFHRQSLGKARDVRQGTLLEWASVRDSGVV